MHVGMGSEHRQEGSEVHLGLGEGWRERLRGPLDAHDPHVVDALREEYLRPPSSQPYQVDRYDKKLNYKVSRLGVGKNSDDPLICMARSTHSALSFCLSGLSAWLKRGKMSTGEI